MIEFLQSSTGRMIQGWLHQLCAVSDAGRSGSTCSGIKLLCLEKKIIAQELLVEKLTQQRLPNKCECLE